MPLVAAQRPVAFTITCMDRDKNLGRCTINFPGTISIADLITNLAAVESLVAALTNAYVVDGTISINLRQSTVFTDLPPESSDVERKGSFSFKTIDDTYGGIEIPSIDPALVIDRTNLLNESNLAVAAFIAFMKNGLTVGGTNVTGKPVTGAGRDFIDFNIARKIHRRSSKG